MGTVALALLAVATLVLLHVIISRTRRPAGQYAALSVLSVSVLVAALAVDALLPADYAGAAPRTLLDRLNFVLLYGALVLMYVTSFSAIQADSPAMAVLLQIDRAGSHGVTLTQMLDELNDQRLILPRLDDLVDGGLVTIHGDRYVIAPAGALFVKPFVVYRTLLKMERGG